MLLKKTNAIIIGKKSAHSMLGKKSSGSHKSAVEKSFNNQYNQKSPLEK
jgi:hypothetical protein